MCKKTMLFVSLVIVIFFILLPFSNLCAQEEAGVSIENGGMGYSIFGQSMINLDDLNAALESKGYTGMSNSFFAVGGGGHAIINNRLIIGGEGQTLLGDAATSGNFKNSINISQVFLNLGYVVYKIKDLRIYPLIGLGAGAMNLNISEEMTALSMEDVLNNPKRSIEMSTGGFLFNLSLGADYLLNFGGDETGRAGMVLGIRAGYKVSPFKGDWMVEDVDVTGAPKMGMTGPYISFMLGGGGIAVKK